MNVRLCFKGSNWSYRERKKARRAGVQKQQEVLKLSSEQDERTVEGAPWTDRLAKIPKTTEAIPIPSQDFKTHGTFEPHGVTFQEHPQASSTNESVASGATMMAHSKLGRGDFDEDWETETFIQTSKPQYLLQFIPTIQHPSGWDLTWRHSRLCLRSPHTSCRSSELSWN